MKKVICIDDKGLPEGADIVKDREYRVISEHYNAMGQKVYLINGVSNEGRTKMGFLWIGYRSDRFAVPGAVKKQEWEESYALN